MYNCVPGIAVGAESLSEGNERLNRPFNDEIRAASEEAKDCEVPMGHTSENVARDFGVSRQMQVESSDRTYLKARIDMESRMNIQWSRTDEQKQRRRPAGFMTRLLQSR